LGRSKSAGKKEKAGSTASEGKQKKGGDKKGASKTEEKIEEKGDVKSGQPEAETEAELRVDEENLQIEKERKTLMLDTPNFEYDFLLNNIREKLAKPLSSGERWAIPTVDVIYEGKSTVLKNFSEIVSKIRRDSEHLFGYLQKELGTSATTDKVRVIFKGRLTQKQIQDRINAFIKEFVLCNECKKPDTHFEKDDRVTILVCEVCGAKRPVNVRKAIK